MFSDFGCCILFHFLFCFQSTFRFCHIFFTLEDRKVHFLNVFLPAAPAAWAAASGPSSGSPPGVGHHHSSRLASSRVVAAPSSALLASRVGVPALVRRQLTGQPQRGRYRLGRRRRHRLSGLSRREGSGLHWNHRFQPRPLVCRLRRLASAGDACHQLHGGHSSGVGGQVDPVAGLDAGPVNGGKFLQGGLEGTKTQEYLRFWLLKSMRLLRRHQRDSFRIRKSL
jgi:hypothetical protein